MKALSMWQPWASMVALGMKEVETRSWRTNYRGPLAIHAAKKWSMKLRAQAEEFIEHAGFFFDRGADAAVLRNPPRGCFVAVVDLVDCFEMDDEWLDTVDGFEWLAGFHGRGRFGWTFKNPRPLAPPIHGRGWQSLWTPTAHLAAIEEGSR